MLPIQTAPPIASIRNSLENDSEFDLELSSIEPGVLAFIELPNLPVGVHNLRFSFASGLAGEFARIDDKQAVICILEDRTYSSITDLRGPLSVQIDPPMPTMEQPWKVESKSRFEDLKLGRSNAKCRSARMRRNERSLPGDFPHSISRCPLMFGAYISKKFSTTAHDGWSEMSSAKSDNFRNRRESGMWKTPLRSPSPQKRGLGCDTTGHDYTARRSSTGQPRLFGAGRAWVG